MVSLKQAVESYFPNEKIVNTSSVNLTDEWKVNLLSRSKYYYLTPLDFIETDKSYYFDRRQPYLKTFTPSLFIGPILLVGFILLLWFTVFGRTPQSFVLIIVVCIFALIPPFINRIINQGLVNILLIKKGWIKKSEVNNGSNLLYGEIPKGNNYSFANNIDSNNLNTWDKVFSGSIFRNIKGLSRSLEFHLSYKTA